MTHQDTVLEYLLSRFYDSQPVVEFDELKENLGFDSNQLAKIKTELIRKGKALNFGKGKVGAIRLIPKSPNTICSQLGKKKGRPYCPKKCHFIAEKDKNYLCGVVQYTTGGNGIGYYNVCNLKEDLR